MRAVVATKPTVSDNVESIVIFFFMLVSHLGKK